MNSLGTKVLWLLTLLALAVGLGHGQVDPSGEAARGAPAAQDEEGDWEETGPRATVHAFFDAMGAGDTTRAIETFEPNSFPTTAQALAAARTLYDDVFLKTKRLRVGTDLPTADEVRGNLYTLRTHPEGDRSLTVDLVFVRVDGEFRFARRTLERLDQLAASLADVETSEAVLEEMGAMESMRARLRASLPAGLLSRSFLIENWQWLGLLCLILAAVVADRFIRGVVWRVALRMLKARGIRLEDEVLLGFGRPLGLLFAALVFEQLLALLGLDSGIRDMLRLSAGFIAAVAGVWAAYRLVDVMCDTLGERASRTANKFDDMLVPLARRTLKIFVVVVGIVFVSSRFSEDVWGVVAGLGLGSIALGFAARDSIENLFGTFTVLLDKPFQIGDWIIVGDLEGTVESVGFRSTRIRTFYNSLITVPNRQFISSSVDNMGERAYRRIRTTLGVTYDTPPEKIEAFCEGIREILRLHPYTRKDYYHVYLNGFGASSLEVMLYCFVETPEWATELREKHRLFADILRLAERLGVSFAFPTQTLHVAKPEDLEHPNRPQDDAAGAALGLKLAAEVVEGSMASSGGAGRIPPPGGDPLSPSSRRRWRRRG